MKQIRKALAAGAATAASTLFASLATEVPRTQAGWVGIVGAAVSAGVVVAYGVWRIPNADPPRVEVL